ncbi:MAG: tetratricopeptide repeat protein [Thermoplasmata archaeon]|nr:tetratricopeptide repeat protein [Thermoplasmata archaeon]
MARVDEIARAVKSVALYHRKDIKNAEELLKNADNSNPDTWIYRGNLRFESEDFDGAIKCYNEALKLSPDNVAALYNKANALLQIGRNEEALRILEKLVKNNPDIEEIWNNLGNIYARRGKVEEAVKAYTKAIELNPDYTVARYNLGMVLAQRGEYAAAMDQFSRVLEREEMVEAYCAMASCEYATNNFQQALKTINKAISLNSKNIDAWLLRAAVLAELEKTEDASNTLKECMKINPENAEVYLAAAKLAAKHHRLREAEETLKDAVERAPENAQAWELLAEIEHQLERYDAAIYAAERALALPESQEHRWYLEYLLGSSHFEKKEYADARRHFENCIAENPGFTETYVKLGFTLIETGMREEGLKLLEKALEMAPDNWKVQYLVAKGKFELGEVEEAGQMLDKLLETNPDSDALLLMGRIMVLRGELEEAIHMFERAVDKNPANFEAWYYKGRTLLETKEMEKAVASLELAIQINPWHYNSHYYLALAYEEENNYAKAAECYEEILKILPRDYQALFNLGKVCAAMEKWDEAYHAFKKGFEVKATYECALLLGIACGKQKKVEEAVEYLEKAVELNPYGDEAYFEAGKAYIEKKEFKKAVEMLEMAVKLAEKSEYLKHLGIAYHHGGNIQKALAIFENLDDTEARVYAAECALSLGDEEKALGFLQSLPPDTGIFHAWMIKGTCEEKLGKLDEALHSYSKAIEVSPDAIDGWQAKGNVLLALDRKAEALECYQQILSKEEKGEYLIRIAEIYIQLKEFEKALESVERAGKLPGAEEKTILWLEGLAYLGLKEFGSARERFEKLIEIEEKPEILLHLATACAGLEDYASALIHLEKYLGTRTDDIAAWKMLSECYYATGDTERCLNALDKCIELNPGMHEAWYNKGTVLLMLGRFEDAEKVLLKAGELMPHDARVWNNLGTAYLGMERYDEAVRAFETAIAAELGNSEAWYNKGVALMRQGRHREAIECFDRAVSINPEYLDALFVKGSAYFEMEEYQKAVDGLTQFLERKPEHFEALVLRGKALQKLGKFGEAKQDFVNAISVEPAQFEPYKLAAVACSMLFEWEEMEKYASVAAEKKAEDAESWYLRAVAALNLGKIKNAIKFCENVEELDKTMLDAYYIEAIARVLEDDMTGAIEIMEKCALANPESARAAFLLGSAHARFGERESALKWFRTAISIEKSERIIYFIARFLYQIERYQECIEMLEGLKALDYLGHYLLGLAYSGTGDIQRALHHFEKSSLEHFLPAKLMLATAHYNLGNYAEALRTLEGVETVEAGKLRGWIYGKLSIWEKAVEELTRYARIERLDGESAYVLALSCFSLKRIVEAKEYLEIAKTVMPGSADRWLLMGRVKMLEAEMENSERLRAEAVECFKRALSLKPETMEVVFELARNLFILGREKEALADAEKLAGSTDMRHVLLAGKIFEKNGMFEEALNAYKVVAEKTGNLESFEGCARCCLKLGDYRKAVDYGEKSLGMDGKSGAIHTVALAKLALGSRDAREYAERSMENGFVDEKLLLDYGKLLLASNEPEGILKIFSRYEELVKGIEGGVLWAEGFLRAGEVQKALAVVDKYLALKEDPELLKIRGDILEKMGERREAIAHYERALRLQPNNSSICLILAGLYLDEGNRSRAREYAERALSLDRKSGEGWYLLARCSEGKEKLEYLQEALRFRENREILLEYSNALLENGDVAEANSWVDKLLSQGEEDAVLLLGASVKLKLGRVAEAEDLAAKIREDSREKQEVCVEIWMQKRDFARAIGGYEKLLAETKKFEYLVGIARAHRELGNYEQAGEYYAQALEINPANEDVWEELAFVQFSRKMFEKLKKTLENYIRLNPQEYAPYYNLGLLLLGDGDLRGAEEAIRKSLALEKDNEKAWNALGNVYLQKGDNEMAKDYFEKAVSINQNYWRGWYNLALVYTKKKDFVQALAMVSNAERTVPDNLEVGLLKGTLLLSQKRIREGEKVFEKLYARNPQNERVIFNYGVAKMLSGKMDEALSLFDKAIERKKDYVEAWVNKGIIHYQRKDYRNAGIAFETVLSYDRNNRIAMKYLEEMEEK